MIPSIHDAAGGVGTNPAGLAASLRRRLPARGVLIVFITYFILRGCILGLMAPVWFSDTEAYATQYRDGLGSGEPGRPWGFPLFLWLTGYRYGLAAIVQRSLAALAWFALARAAAGLFRRPAMRHGAFYAILTLSMAMFVIQWDAMLLSESLSVSLFVMLTAAWCRLMRVDAMARGIPWLGVMAALAIPFAGLRDASAPLLMLLALLAGTWVVLRYWNEKGNGRSELGWRPRFQSVAALALAGAIALIALAHHQHAQASRRGWANIGNVLSMRAFAKEIFKGAFTVDTDNVVWMAQRYGLPEKEAAARVGRNVSQAPPLSPAYRAWLETTGPRAWTGFLLHHPGWLCKHFSVYQVYDITRTNYTGVEPDKWKRANLWPAAALQKGINVASGWLLGLKGLNVILMLVSAGLAGAWVWAMRAGRKNVSRAYAGAAFQVYCAPLGVLLWLTAAGLLAALVAFVGDSIETWRHALPGLVALYIAMTLGLGLMAEAGLDWLTRKHIQAGNMQSKRPAEPKTRLEVAKKTRRGQKVKNA